MLARFVRFSGNYNTHKIVNGKASWKSTSGAIWFDSAFKDWAVGSLEDIGSSKRALISFGDHTEKIPSDIPNDDWKYWDGNAWTIIPIGDVNIKCTGKSKSKVSI